MQEERSQEMMSIVFLSAHSCRDTKAKHPLWSHLHCSWDNLGVHIMIDTAQNLTQT